MLFKRVVNSDVFRIYWPLLLLWLFATVFLYLFLPVNPGSQKESVFVWTGTVAFLSCLWIVISRYRKVKGKSVGRRVKALLIILTVLCLFGMACGALAFFR